jgi:hypothetical protein
MTLVMLAYAILLPTLAGFFYVAFFLPSDEKHGFFERLFLGFGIGTGIVTFEMFIIGLLKIPFSTLIISLTQVATIIILVLLARRSGRSFRKVFAFPSENSRNRPLVKANRLWSVFAVVLSVWILARVFFVWYESFLLPVNSYDSWTHWSSGAKFIFYEKGLALDPANEYFFGRGYLKVQRYPLNVPLMQVWASLCMGEAHEVYMKVWSAFYFICIAGLLFFSVSRETSPRAALLAAFFVSSAPLLTYHAVMAYADLPLGYYALGAAICLWRYVGSVRGGNGRGGGGWLVLMGTFVAFGIWTKMEGLMFAVAFSAGLALLLFMKRIPLKRFTSYLIPVIAVAVPWYIFLLTTGIEVSYGEEKAVEQAVAQGFHLEVLPVILKEIALSANFNIIFPFFFLLCLLGVKAISRSDLRYLLAPVFFAFALFLFLYVGTGNYIWVMKLTAINRNMLTFLPVMYFVTALTAVQLVSRSAR